MKPNMTRIVALLTLLVFLPAAARAQTVDASVYAQTPAPQPIQPGASDAALALAIDERIAYAEQVAAEQNWREASRILREAERIDASAQRVRLAHLGVRHRVAPSLVLRLDDATQAALLHHVDTANGFTIAGHVFGILGAASAVVGVVILVLGAVGVALSAGLATIFGTSSSASLDGLAPIVGLTGGIGLGLAAVGGGFHLAASGESRAVRVALVPQASADGGGVMLAGTF